MLTTTQKQQFLQEHIMMLRDTQSTPPRDFSFLQATRADFQLYPATLEVLFGQYTMYPDQSQGNQWLDQVLPWLLPLFASDTETVYELLERLDPEVLARHLGYADRTAQLDARADQLKEMAEDLGLEAEICPVQHRTRMVVITNLDSPFDGYLVPVDKLWRILTYAEKIAAAPDAIWDQVLALARTVTITVQP
jgi:hypothetical protein